MTERQIENRVCKLRELEAQIKAIEADADAIRSEIKAEMEQQEAEMLTTKNFVIRWKEVIRKTLDSKALKSAAPEIYAAYCRESGSRRFTVMANA